MNIYLSAKKVEGGRVSTISDNEVVDLPLDQLTVHPINRQIYTNDPARKAELLESIKQNGILEPLIVTPQDKHFVILSGARRYDCAKELGLKTVPCIVTMVKDQILAVIEHNKYRQKTPVEIYNEAQMLKKILEPEAKQKESLGGKLKKGFSDLKNVEPVHVHEIVAEKLNVSTGYLNMLEQVMEHKNEIPDIVQKLETGRETVYSAYNQLKNKIRPQVKIPEIFIGKYFAGKKYLVKDIIARIPPHTCYVEPFGGFCAVLLNKPFSPLEVYNDISKDVVNLLLCLKEYPLELISELYLMPHSRWLYEQLIPALGESFEVPNVKRAAIWYYLNTFTFTGLDNIGLSPGRWAHSHAVRARKPVIPRARFNMMLTVSARLIRVQIENKDYKYILEHYDSPDTFFYVDPPYYETDVALGLQFTPEQHTELRDMLSHVKGKWLLTINEHPKVKELYRNFHIEKIVVPKFASDAKDTGGVREYHTHLLISNFENT